MGSAAQPSAAAVQAGSSAGPLRVSIVDDDPSVGRTLGDWIRAVEPAASVVLYESAEGILLDRRPSEIVFMDIRLAGTDGIEAVRRLRQRHSGTVFIFISALREYVFDAFDVHPFHFLVKPVDRDKAMAVFTEACMAVRAEQKRSGGRFVVEGRSGSVSLPITEVAFVERSGRKLRVHTAAQIYEMYGALDQLAGQLGSDFYRCHRSVLVNLSWVMSYTRDTILLSGDRTVSLARKKYTDFVKRYLWFLNGRDSCPN